MAHKKAKAKDRPEPEMFTIFADILQETEATDGHEGAILINCGSSKNIWLPVSQLEFYGERGDVDVPITLPDWLADDNGLFDGQNDPDTREATHIGEAVDNITESVTPPAQPEKFFYFTAKVEHVYEGKYAFLVTNKQGNTATLEFEKGSVSYIGQEDIDLQEGYEGMEFTVSYELALEKHLPEFLGIETVFTVSATEEAVPTEPYKPAATMPYNHCLRRETVEAVVKLTDEERLSYGKEMVEALRERAENKKTASFYSGKAKSAEDEAYRIMEVLEDDEEKRRISCDVVADFDADQLVYVESEWPHREVRRERLTEKDRQLRLPLEQPQEVKASEEGAEAQEGGSMATEPEEEQAHSCATCAHMFDTPEGDESSPCAECGQAPDLPNWQDAHIPTTETAPPAEVVQ